MGSHFGSVRIAGSSSVWRGSGKENATTSILVKMSGTNSRGAWSAVGMDNITKLIRHVNRKDWWHVTPEDTRVYRERGKFFCSTFAEAEFYGRPNDIPERVEIKAPVVGDEATIEQTLIGHVEAYPDISVQERFALDAKLFRAALQKGYDSIVLMTPKAFQKYKDEGKLARSIELNVVDLRCMRSSQTQTQAS